MVSISQLAEAVKEELNGASFSQPFTAQRCYRPAFELSEMDQLHVTVVPKGLTIQTASRYQQQYDCQIDIAIQKRFQEGDNIELDSLMTLVSEIMDFFKVRKLTACTQALWVKTENVPLYAPEHIDQLRQFTSLITLTYRILQ